jgi:hypothetical protein
MLGNLFMIGQQWAAVINPISHLFLVTVSEQCVLSLEQRVFLYDSYVKYESARKCRRKLRRKFCDERVPRNQTIRNLVNKLTSTWLLTDKTQKHKRRVLTEEKLDDTEARVEHARRKLLTRVECQRTATARTSTQLLNPRPYKKHNVVYSLSIHVHSREEKLKVMLRTRPNSLTQWEKI